MSCLVGNPKDTFCRVVAQMFVFFLHDLFFFATLLSEDSDSEGKEYKNL